MAKRKSQTSSLRPKPLPAKSGGELVAAVAELRELVQLLAELLADVRTFNRMMAVAGEEVGEELPPADAGQLLEVAGVEDETPVTGPAIDLARLREGE